MAATDKTAMDKSAEPVKAPEITSNHSSPLSICGVVIAKGETKPIPNFDPKNSVMKKWIAAKVIAVK